MFASPLPFSCLPHGISCFPVKDALLSDVPCSSATTDFIFFRIASHPWIDTNLPRSFSSYIGNLLPPSDSLCPSWSSVPSYLSFGASCAYCLIQLGITIFNFRIVSHSWIDVKLTGFVSFHIVNLLPSSDSLFSSWSSLPSYHSFSASGVYCLTMLGATVSTFPHRFPSTD